MIDINLKGAWIVGRHVIPHMIAARARLDRQQLDHRRACAAWPASRHYAASKWGLTGLSKSWAIELAPHGIRVNSIHPTGVDTPLNDGLAAMEGMTTQEIAERSAGNLLPVPVDRAERRRRGGALPRRRGRPLRDGHDARDRRRPAHPLTVTGWRAAA